MTHSVKDLVQAIDRMSGPDDAQREARGLLRAFEPRPTSSSLETALATARDAAAAGDFVAIGFPKNAPTAESALKAARLFQLFFYLGLELNWEDAIRDGSFAAMHILIDKLHRFDDALDWGNRVLRGAKNPAVHQITFGDQGLAYIHQGDSVEAIKCISAALELARLRDDVGYVPKYLGDLGAAYSRSGQFRIAERCLERAIEAGQRLPAFEFATKFAHDLQTVRAAIAEETLEADQSPTKH